ncbi:MAG: helix-turn-helix domain-containing protein [Rhodopila sp.]|jgi:transposase-like protein
MSETDRSSSALARFRLIRSFLEDGIPLTTSATEHGVSLRTLRRWVCRYL